MDFFNFVKDNKLIILLTSITFNILLFITLLLCGYLYFNKECICEKEICMNNEVNEEEKFYVEVKGAVKTPGVYEVNSNNIINDVITMSGGFTKKAYTKNINLSKKVSNELVIYVYTNTEYKKDNIKKVVEESVCECSTYEISNCTDNLTSEIISSDNDTVFESEVVNNEVSKVNINTASETELMELSGIGESKAKAIIEYRNISVFKSIEEIKNVSGIGDSLFEKIKDNITV